MESFPVDRNCGAHEQIVKGNDGNFTAEVFFKNLQYKHILECFRENQFYLGQEIKYVTSLGLSSINFLEPFEESQCSPPE